MVVELGFETILVLSIPSGDEILRVEIGEIYDAFERSDEGRFLGYLGLAPWGANGWSADGTAVATLITDRHSTAVPGAILTLDGNVIPLSLGLEAEGSNLSPDARYVVRGRAKDSDEYTHRNWRSFDILHFATGRVLWSFEIADPRQRYHWEWASPTEFAWSSGAWPDVFHFDLQRPDSDAERAEVSVLDVRTGEVDVLDSADYLARFHPPPPAKTECPEHPAHACKILLDGEVVGEGRWPRIIGFIELGE